MKEKIRQFMQGRYGIDQYGRFLLGAALVAIVLSMFFARSIVGLFLDYTGLVLLVYSYVRVFSRNISKRYGENQKYLEKTQKIRNWFLREKNLMGQRKEYHIYSCPGCKQKIRIPRGKGKIEISCPKCGTKFVKRS